MTHAWRLAAFLVAAVRTVLVVSQATILPINVDQVDEVTLLQTVKKLQTLVKNCKGKLDIILIVDESSTVCSVSPFTIYASTSRTTYAPCAQTCYLPPLNGMTAVYYRGLQMYKFQAQMYFMWDIVTHVELGPDDVHVAIVGMNAGWTGEIHPDWGIGPRLMADWSWDANELWAGIETLRCSEASFPHLGFEFAQGVLSRGRPDAHKIAVVLMGATPDGGPWEAAADALKADAQVMGVGYSYGADEGYVERIATDHRHAFYDYDLSASLQILVAPESDEFCKMACEDDNTCEIFEDPHVLGFDDHRKGPLSLLGTSTSVRNKSKGFSGHPLNVDLFETGDFWLIRSESVKVQGRVLRSGAFKPNRPALVAVAIGGPFLHGYTLQLGTLGSQLLWHGRPVRLGNSTFSYPNGTVRFRHHKGLHKKHHLKHHFEANFSSGFKVVADRFPKHLNIKLITKKIEGGMDGECGNFNKVHSDDTKEALIQRMGSLRVPEAEKMITVRFFTREQRAHARAAAAAKRRHGVHRNATLLEVSQNATGVLQNVTPLDMQH